MRTIFSTALFAGVLAGTTRSIDLKAEVETGNEVNIYDELASLKSELALVKTQLAL